MYQRQRRTLSEFNLFPDGKLTVAEIMVHGAQFYTFKFLRILVMVKQGILTLSLDTMIVYMTEEKNLLFKYCSLIKIWH